MQPNMTGISVFDDSYLFSAITSFLREREKAEARVCTLFHSRLPHYMCIKGPSFTARGPTGADAPLVCLISPALPPSISKIEVSILWADQGWGNRKGQIIAKLCRVGKGQRKVVAECSVFGTAQHHVEAVQSVLTATAAVLTKAVVSPIHLAGPTLSRGALILDIGTVRTVEIQNGREIVQNAREGDVLEFWRFVGGGGGHSLTLKDFKVVLKHSL